MAKTLFSGAADPAHAAPVGSGGLRLDLRGSRQDKGNRADWRTMPSFIRFLVVVALIAAAVYGGMLALTIWVEPNPREMSVRVPAERLQP